MRKLTIRRSKSFVACLMKVKVYIEDPFVNELTIDGVPCRKLGDLKNNEEKAFEIGDGQAKVFVIADTLSKDYCNDSFQLPAGQDDIFLSGKNTFNSAGNAFRFDNNDSPEVLKARKKGAKKGLVIWIVAIVVGFAVGFGAVSFALSGVSVFNFLTNSKTEAKVFAENGMSITLTNEFRELDVDTFTNCYESDEVAVFALKEEFSMLDGSEDYTLTQYGELVLKNNGMDSFELQTADGLTYFEYESTIPDTNDVFTYFSFIFKTDDAFWLIQFATKTEDVKEVSPSIVEWAHSITFE